MVEYNFANTIHGTEARTLPARYVGKHPSGWIISGEIKQNLWVNEFVARKGTQIVKGDFETIVKATSEKTFAEFIRLFPYVDWNYKDVVTQTK